MHERECGTRRVSGSQCQIERGGSAGRCTLCWVLATQHHMQRVCEHHDKSGATHNAFAADNPKSAQLQTAAGEIETHFRHVVGSPFPILRRLQHALRRRYCATHAQRARGLNTRRHAAQARARLCNTRESRVNNKPVPDAEIQSSPPRALVLGSRGQYLGTSDSPKTRRVAIFAAVLSIRALARYMHAQQQGKGICLGRRRTQESGEASERALTG